MDLLTIALMAAVFVLTRVTKLRTAVHIFVFQSGLIALACLVSGGETGEVHFYLAALFTVVIKVGIIPYFLYHIVSRLRREREDRPLWGPNASSLGAAAAIVLAYGFISQVLPGVVSRETLAAAAALVLIGLELIMTRRQALLQIVGLNTMENGLYLLGLSMTKGLPLIIELGIFLDVMVAVVVLVILTYRLKISFLSTDTSKLQKLKG